MAERLRAWVRRRQPELRLALRSTVAGLIAFAIGHALGLPQAWWAVLTAVVVMQTTLGASLKATLDRLLGTLGGAVWGVVGAVVVPRTGLVSLGVSLAVALAPVALLAALRPAYRMAPVTAIIVVLGAQGQQSDAIRSATDRLLDVGLGGVVALLVALVVLPVRAHGLLTEAAARALDVMAEQIVVLMEGLGAVADPVALEQMRSRTRDTVARAEAVAEEAARERAHHLTGAPDPESLLRTLRRLRHDLTMIERATAVPLPDPVRTELAQPAARAAAEIATFLRAARAALVAPPARPSLDGVGRTLDDYATAMAELRRQGVMRELSGEAAERVFGLAFALEQLRSNLGDLADRVSPFSDGRA